MLLAIDTSTRLSGLALYNEQGLRGESVWHSGRNHSAQVLPQLDALLRYLGQQPGDLRAVAIALGPGSWSGLRVGLSLAKGIAIAGRLPLFGVGTLDAMAYQFRSTAPQIYPLIALGRGRFATAGFSSGDGLIRQGEYRNLSLDEICATVSERTLFCGDIEGETADAIRQNCGRRAILPSPAANLRRPGCLAELAWERFSAGECDDLALLEPIYLGDAVRKK
jgi:tRNA threonylcarbamoyladenosine biosynthesis protein TsaB